MKTYTFNHTKQHDSKWRRIVFLVPILPLLIGVIFSAPQTHAAPTVTVSTYAGTTSTVGYVDGTSAAAQFNYPHDIALDASGTMYVADTSNNRIRAISPAGVVTTFAGSGVAGGADGTGTAAEFNSPHSIAINPTTGVLYVTEASLVNNTPRVRAITPTGVVTTLAGSGVTGLADGTGTAAQFFFPTGIAVNASTGMIYVADSYAHSIRAITPAGVVTTLVGYDDISDVAANPNGSYSDGTGTAAQFSYPQGIDVDASGMIYVAEFGGHRIRKITPSGDVTTLAGSGVAGNADGTGTAAQFDRPIGVVVDPSGNVYIADAFNNRIRKITPAGVVTTVAGNGTAGHVDGAGDAAEFNAPTGLVLDPAGRLYVTDTYNQLIRLVTFSEPPVTPESPTQSIPSAPDSGAVQNPGITIVMFVAISSALLISALLIAARSTPYGTRRR